MKGKPATYCSRKQQQHVVQVVMVHCMVAMGWWVQRTACCSTSWAFNGSVHTFEKCVDLPVQAASLAWTLVPPGSSSSVSSLGTQYPEYYILELAFSGTAPSANGWVGWGLNPHKAQMAGSSAFLAYSAPNGSTLLPYRLTPATMGGAPLLCSSIDYTLLQASAAVQISGSSMAMLLTLLLNASAPTPTLLHHVWNRGPSVANFQPAPHSMLPRDLQALTRIDMSSAQIRPAPPTISASLPATPLLKQRHGVINAIAWGLILPIGVIFARYLKPFADPIWFYMHIIFQCVGYVLGASGWVMGLQLARVSHGAVFHKHRNIGMVLFALSSLQVMALLVRPKKEHSARRYWNIYHHSVGYVVIVLGITNVFEGLAISGVFDWPYHAFICSIVALGAIALLLEIIIWTRWFVFLNRQREACNLHESSFISHSPHQKQTKNIVATFGPTEHILRVV